MKFKLILSTILVSGLAFASYADGYKDGVEYYQAGQEKNAEIVLTETINNPATDKAEAYYYLGCITLHKGDKANAEKYFDQGIQANAEYAYNYIGKGAIALRNNNKDLAEDLFKQAEKINKKDAKVKVDIARAYYEADKALYNKEWNKALNDAKKKDKKEASIYMFEGDVFADEKKYGDSAGYYEMAIMYDTERPIAYVKYANTYFHINPEIAIQKLEEIVAKNPNSALAQRELAEKYYENDQWTKAAEQYKHVVDNPNHFASDEERYVVLLYFGKNYAESFSRAESLLQKNPNSFLMKRMKFLNAAAESKYTDAEKYAEEFFAAGNADNIFSSNDYTTYGEVLKELGKEKESLSAFEKAVEINPDKTELLKDLSSAYSNAANDTAIDKATQAEYFLKAAKYYQQFIDKGSYENGDYTTNDMFVLAGRYQNVLATATDETVKNDAFNNAIAVIDKVIAKAPEDYRVQQRKARICLVKEGDNRKEGLAVAPYQKMEELVNKDAELEQAKKEDALKEAYMYFASYYLANNDTATAKSFYQKYLALDPTNEALRKYIENMK